MLPQYDNASSSCLRSYGQYQHGRADQKVQVGNPQGDPLQRAAPRGEGTALLLVTRLPLRLRQLSETPPEVRAVRDGEGEDEEEQRVLRVKCHPETRKDAIQNGEEREQDKVHAPHPGIPLPYRRADRDAFGLGPFHRPEGRRDDGRREYQTTEPDSSQHDVRDVEDIDQQCLPPNY